MHKLYCKTQHTLLYCVLQQQQTLASKKKENISSYKENEKEVQVAFKGVNKGVSVLYLVQLVVISHT